MRACLLIVFTWCLVLGIWALLGEAQAAGFCADAQRPYVANAVMPEGFCAVTWASGLRRPRAIRFASNGDALVLESTGGTIRVLWDDNKDGVSSDSERALLTTMAALNHGLVIDEKNGFIYASTPREVWRWHYRVGQRTPLGTSTRVIYGIPCCGHLTRTLEMDEEGNLYVSVGSLKNVDRDDTSAMIRRFVNPAAYVTAQSWQEGEIWARGMRNEVGIRFDYHNPRRLWGVENGVDNIQRTDLGDVHDDNPAEEVNLFDKPGAFYGYPYCWSEYNLQGSRLSPGARPGHTRGTQWLHPSFIRDDRFSDAWCDDPANVVKPAYSLQAHTAPLDIVFYNGTSFPSAWRGDAFIALHGSWNRPQPVGYNVVRLVMNQTTGMPDHELPFFSPQTPTKRHDGHESDEGEDPYPAVPGWWNTRPVSLDFGPCGASNECLFIVSDKTGVIIAVAYGGGGDDDVNRR
jgi:glucose/arabinose dehydrogenase